MVRRIPQQFNNNNHARRNWISILLHPYRSRFSGAISDFSCRIPVVTFCPNSSLVINSITTQKWTSRFPNQSVVVSPFSYESPGELPVIIKTRGRNKHSIMLVTGIKEYLYSWRSPNFKAGIRALKEKVAKGLEIVTEFSMVPMLVLIAWQILSTFATGVVPTAKRGNSSEDAVYLMIRM